jgi:predicted amidophosphoribosyltransferase
MRYYYMMDYLPVRYSGAERQIADRKAVWNFKDGCAPARIVSGLAEHVARIAGGHPSDFVVCFVPASSEWKTSRRYCHVANEIQRLTGVPASLGAVTRHGEAQPGHIAGKAADPAAEFTYCPQCYRGKNVILIDDVVTRGRTLSGTGERILRGGAASVVGLVVARTINPDWAA